MVAFTKAYSRDFSIIMEEAWYHALSKGLWDKLGEKPPEGWPNFYYFNRGIIEVWNNKEYIRRIMGAVSGKKAKFFGALIREYETLVKKLKEDKISDEEYIKILYDAISMFSIVWYGIQDGRTEKNIRETLVNVRDTDTIFDSCDRIVRKRVQRKYPLLKGVDTAILKDEFLSDAPARGILQKRLENFILVPGEVSETVKLEEFARKNNIQCNIDQPGSTGIVKGTTAYPGKVVGKARIIRRKDEIAYMQQGEVLISPMTTPDVFPAMSKACAVVTDEGGMLSHAAIISREQKIPCVIGTKVASITFKNGDLLEVDAAKGIVKKIV